MPIVTIDSWPMPAENKPKIIKKITGAFTDLGIPAEAVTILIKETNHNRASESIL